jgi:hypothetical protein
MYASAKHTLLNAGKLRFCYNSREIQTLSVL